MLSCDVSFLTDEQNEKGARKIQTGSRTCVKYCKKIARLSERKIGVSILEGKIHEKDPAWSHFASRGGDGHQSICQANKQYGATDSSVLERKREITRSLLG